jgi:hypothetical protein
MPWNYDDVGYAIVPGEAPRMVSWRAALVCVPCGPRAGEGVFLQGQRECGRDALPSCPAASMILQWHEYGPISP